MAFLMFRSMTSFGTLSAFASRMIAANARFVDGSSPPDLTAMTTFFPMKAAFFE